MADLNFKVSKGFTSGNLTIDAVTGDITTSGNISTTANVNVTGTGTINATNLTAGGLLKGNASVGITDAGAGSTMTFILNNSTVQVVDTSGLNLNTGLAYRINGTSVLNSTTLGAGVVSSSLTSVGTLTSLNVSGTATVGSVSGDGAGLTTLNASNIASGTLAEARLSGSYTGITTVGNLTALSVGGSTDHYGNINVHGSTSNALLALQDGTGRVNLYWNTNGSATPTFTVSGEDALSLLLNQNGTGFGGLLAFRTASGLGETAGNAITWTNPFTVSNQQAAFTGQLVTTNTTPSTSTTTGAAVIAGGLGVAGNAYIGGNVIVSGDVTILGNTTTFSSNNVSFQDSIIYLADGNTGDVLDIGMVSAFTNPGYQHTGFVRDATDGIWKLFANVVAEPTTTVNFTNAIYASAQFGNIRVNPHNSTTAIINAGTNGVGNIGASGAGFNTVFAKSTSAQYADLAELYAADAEYRPGTVVSFGGSAEITISTVSHDSAVAGVISTNPAHVMNSALAGGLPVALQGRVPCQVKGPISKGDLVVASDIAGVAGKLDKSQYTPGCVIGKSLGVITTDTVETIEVVVGRV